jgi:hypothetical protein
MSRRLRQVLPLALAAALVLAAETALGCPNCKSTVAADSADGRYGDPASGFGYSVYLMLGGVLGIGGSLVAFVVRAVQRADAATP